MIKGLITILTSYCGFDAASDFIQVATIAGTAYSISSRF